MSVPLTQTLQCNRSVVCCRLIAVGLVLMFSGCGGNGTAPSQAIPGQQQPMLPTGAYPVPGYAQPPPGYAQGYQQQATAWGTPQQPQVYAQPPVQMPPQVQAYQQVQTYQQPQAQMYQQPQAQAQMYQQPQVYSQTAPQYGAATPVPAPAPSYSDNPWVVQARQNHYSNSWATSQPWGATATGGNTTAGRYRPIEGETPATATPPPAVTPYDQVYGSSQRPVPNTPNYGGAVAGAYPGQYLPYPGQYPSQYPGGWPGGYGGGYPGIGAWPGGWGGGMPFGAYPGVAWPFVH